jgi:hypothetical protein
MLFPCLQTMHVTISSFDKLQELLKYSWSRVEWFEDSNSSKKRQDWALQSALESSRVAGGIPYECRASGRFTGTHHFTSGARVLFYCGFHGTRSSVYPTAKGVLKYGTSGPVRAASRFCRFTRAGPHQSYLALTSVISPSLLSLLLLYTETLGNGCSIFKSLLVVTFTSHIS